MKVRITHTIEVDFAAWSLEFGLASPDEVRDDVQTYFAGTIDAQLETLGLALSGEPREWPTGSLGARLADERPAVTRQEKATERALAEQEALAPCTRCGATPETGQTPGCSECEGVTGSRRAPRADAIDAARADAHRAERRLAAYLERGGDTSTPEYRALDADAQATYGALAELVHDTQ